MSRSINLNNKGTGSVLRGAMRRVLNCAILGLLSSQVVGCAQKAAEVREPIHDPGSFNPPMVISSRPKHDSIAYAASEEKLSDADWQELEKLGPRPIWEQLESKRCRHHCAEGHACTEPSAKAITPQPATMPSLDESELPVQVIDLPDGKVRMIWTLRSYGGTMVESARDAATARRTVKVTPPDLTPLVTVLTQNLGPGGTVAPLPRENAVIVTCDKTMRTPVLTLLSDLDRPPRQVEITAKIFEVNHDFDFQQGTELLLNRLASDPAASLSSTFSAKRFLDAVNAPTAAPVQGSVLRLMQAFQSAGISVDVSFQLLAESGMIQVVSEPRMTVAVGQTGYMLAGQEIPIQSNNLINNVVQIATQYKPVGVQLYITPEAAGPDRVKLHTISIVSAVAGFSPLLSMTGGSQPLLNPVIDSREAETAVTVDDGSTLVISGLRMIRTTTRENKIPGLGDVPVFGWLFKNHRSQQQQTDLYFFITPTLL